MNLQEYSEIALQTGATKMPKVHYDEWDILHRLIRNINYTSRLLIKVCMENEDNVDDNFEMITPKFWGLTGLVGEAGEVLDYLKKVFLHKKPVSINILKDELGDMLWYWNYTLRKGYNLTIEQMNIEYFDINLEDGFMWTLINMFKTICHIAKYFNLSIEEIMQHNKVKLVDIRYKDGFKEGEGYNELS